MLRKTTFSKRVCVESGARGRKAHQLPFLFLPSWVLGSDFLSCRTSPYPSGKGGNLPADRVGLEEQSSASLRSRHWSPTMGCNGYQQDTAWALKSDNLCSNPGSVTYQLLKEISGICLILIEKMVCKPKKKVLSNSESWLNDTDLSHGGRGEMMGCVKSPWGGGQSHQHLLHHSIY